MTERYTEVKIRGEGVSVSLYDGDELVDEYWRTWDEVEDVKSDDHVAILK